jgi:hypothetical protein
VICFRSTLHRAFNGELFARTEWKAFQFSPQAQGQQKSKHEMVTGGVSIAGWRASRLWLSAAPIQICWPGRRSMRCWHDAASLKSSACRIRVTRPCLLSPR